MRLCNLTLNFHRRVTVFHVQLTVFAFLYHVPSPSSHITPQLLPFHRFLYAEFARPLFPLCFPSRHMIKAKDYRNFTELWLKPYNIK